MSSVENSDIKASKFLYCEDLDIQGYGRLYYADLEDGMKSEFLNITSEKVIYEVYDLKLGSAAMIFTKGVAHPVNLSTSVAFNLGLIKENKDLLKPIKKLNQEELIAKVALIIADKKPKPIFV